MSYALTSEFETWNVEARITSEFSDMQGNSKCSKKILLSNAHSVLFLENQHMCLISIMYNMPVFAHNGNLETT